MAREKCMTAQSATIDQAKGTKSTVSAVAWTNQKIETDTIGQNVRVCMRNLSVGCWGARARSVRGHYEPSLPLRILLLPEDPDELKAARPHGNRRGADPARGGSRGSREISRRPPR